MLNKNMEANEIEQAIERQTNESLVTANIETEKEKKGKESKKKKTFSQTKKKRRM